MEQWEKANFASLLSKLESHISNTEWGDEKAKTRIYDQVISSLQRGKGLPGPGLSNLCLLEFAALMFFERRFWVID